MYRHVVVAFSMKDFTVIGLVKYFDEMKRSIDDL